MRIVIVGGGISGLSTAYYLQKCKPECEVIICEAQSSLGGTMHTVNKDNFLFETGSNGFLTNKPDTLDLVKSCGAEELLLKSSDNARKRFIFDKSLEQLPESPKSFLTTNLLTVSQKIRVLCEPFIKAKLDDKEESVAEFGERRLGKGFVSVFLDAMVAGIYAAKPENLSLKAAFPTMVALEKEYGGLFKGMIKKKKKGAGPGGVLMSFKGGVESFIKHLEKELNADLLLNCKVNMIEMRDEKYLVHGSSGEIIEADKVVISTPAYEASNIIKPISDELSNKLSKIEYNPITVVGLGYKELKHEMNGFGLLTTSRANKKILGALWDSSIFYDRAPSGEKAIRCLIGGGRNKELFKLDEEQSVEVAKKDLKDIMGIDEEPDTVFVKKWKNAIPSYEVNHPNRVKEIFETVEKIDGIYLNSNAYKGIGLNDCVRESRMLAESICKEMV